MTAKPWTTKAVKELRGLRSEGKTVKEIAVLIGRTYLSVRSKLEVLKINAADDRYKGLWSKEKEELLRKHWAADLTARKISTLMGISRSAVIGKAHRLKLPSRSLVQSNPPKKKLKKTTEREKPTALPPEPDILNGISMLELKRTSCRWPVGDPKTGLKFCPEPNDGKHVYCTYHTSRAFTPTLVRPR